MNEVNKISDQEFKARVDSLDINEINYLAAKKKKREDKIALLKDLCLYEGQPERLLLLKEIIDDYVLPN